MVPSEKALRALLHLEDRVGYETVRFTVHGVGGFCIRSLDEAEDSAGTLVDPVPQIIDAELLLCPDILHVSLGDIIGRDPTFDLVHIHEQWHDNSFRERT